MSILLGAIADDFTGATDLANTLVKGGMRTIQTIGVPGADIDTGEVDAIVIALKSRTIAAEDAVRESVKALNWLKSHDAEQYFFKYCSTFDSTDEGNIGPVADALLERLNSCLTIVCPAFPTTARTVYKGHLFVGDFLLSESSMKDHPLTPMRDSDLVQILGRQTQKNVELIPYETVVRGDTVLSDYLRRLEVTNVSYAVVDAINDSDLRTIGKAVSGFKLVTGGSGIALGLPDNFRIKGFLKDNLQLSYPNVNGGPAILAGSCSEATRRQIDHVSDMWPLYRVEPEEIASGTDVIADVIQWVREQDPKMPLVLCSSSDPDTVAFVQDQFGREEAGAMVENFFAVIAPRLVSEGRRKIVVAGGETSGAVVSALDVKALEIGPEIDPGVPWCTTLQGEPLALALKSGNFGSVDFFEKAFGLLP